MVAGGLATQVYNVSSEEYVTFDGMAKLCAEAAGVAEPKIVHYDPKSVEVPEGPVAVENMYEYHDYHQS